MSLCTMTAITERCHSKLMRTSWGLRQVRVDYSERVRPEAEPNCCTKVVLRLRRIQDSSHLKEVRLLLE